MTITPVPPALTAAISQTSACGANGVRYTEGVTSLSLTNGPPNATITVTLNYGGGDSNAFATPSVVGTFTTNASGAGTFTGSTSINTNSAIATYPPSVFVTVAAGATYVASANATLTNGAAASCSQPLTLTAAVSQGAFCGDSYPLLTYIENLTSLTLTGGPANTPWMSGSTTPAAGSAHRPHWGSSRPTRAVTAPSAARFPSTVPRHRTSRRRSPWSC